MKKSLLLLTCAFSAAIATAETNVASRALSGGESVEVTKIVNEMKQARQRISAAALNGTYDTAEIKKKRERLEAMKVEIVKLIQEINDDVSRLPELAEDVATVKNFEKKLFEATKAKQ